MSSGGNQFPSERKLQLQNPIKPWSEVDFPLEKKVFSMTQAAQLNANFAFLCVAKARKKNSFNDQHGSESRRPDNIMKSF
jgi:hypothetical protein